jgi:hypothetical protein
MKINSIQLRLAKAFITSILVFCSCFSYGSQFNSAEMMIAKIDPVPAQQVIIQFLKWYKTNLNKANNFPILVKDSADNFMVNKAASTSYLNFLKSSQCISQKYIEYWKVFFDDKASELRDHPIQSDIPEGFDMDFVLITQEPDLVLDQIDHIKFKTISMNASVAVIEVKWPRINSLEYKFEMYKTIAGWQIGYISNPNFD